LADRGSLRLRTVASRTWRKIGGYARPASGATDRVSAVIEVREPGYVPDAANRRAAISPTLFTADVERDRLPDLERDPLVQSVEVGRPLHPSD
jgi:hypothetical protein